MIQSSQDDPTGKYIMKKKPHRNFDKYLHCCPLAIICSLYDTGPSLLLPDPPIPGVSWDGVSILVEVEDLTGYTCKFSSSGGPKM